MSKLKTLFLALAVSYSLGADECCTYSTCGSWSLYGDYLYFQAREDNVIYGFRQKVAVTGPSNAEQDQIALKSNFDWDSGFRVGCAYENAEKDLRADARWVRFHTKAHSHATVTPYSNVVTLINTISLYDYFAQSIPSGSTLFQGFGTVTNHLKLNIDWVDVAVSKCFSPYCQLWVRTEIGARYLKIEQNFETTGTSPTDFSPVRNFLNKATVSSWACGLEAAISSGYNLPCGLGIKGFFGGAILYSEYKIRSRVLSTTSTFPVVVLNSLESGTRYKSDTATPMLDIGVTLVYDAEISGFPVDLHVGWEQHILFHVNQAQRSGNLSLSGINVGANVSF